MNKMLTDDQIAGYQRDGFVTPLSPLTIEEAAHYRARMEASEAAAGGILPTSHKMKSHLIYTWAYELVTHPKVLDAVEDVLGPNLLCWSTSIFNKAAQSTDYVSWHQDATYWGLSQSHVVTAWIALSAATVESGCMRFVAGTHKVQVPHEDKFGQSNLLSRGQEIAVTVAEKDAIDIVLHPGQMSLHHVLLFHGSKANVSADRRFGFAIRYIPPYLRQIEGPRDAAMLVRGEDTHGHFESEPAPQRDLDPTMISLHKEVSARQTAILYRGTGRDPNA